MDLATVIGIVLGFGLILMAIMLGGELGMFINVPSLLIVIGGTIAAMFIKHKMSDVFGSVGIMMKAFLVKQENPDQVIGQLIDMANIARKDGILALEKVKSDDPFLQGAVNHCVDGADPEFLEGVLNKDLEYLADRHAKGIAIWEGIGETAPAFGMIGTLIGLVQMLATMDDPSSIGPAMAVALLTTLYGSIFANVIAIPIAVKLDMYSKDEQMTRQIIIDGMIGIQKGVNPRMLQEALKAALPPSMRDGE
ncbi:motility protein A [Magnetofaba australis]|uniref:Putative MotA/TolQ/ExbB proton channel n=1 Tax=Magnetofaba australis IT-1 TaxID=1434232 RepID=A0A1Y2K3G6_9PROT|nr:MotA/TolQ/ExbB proton channel family protein [Magnetofaba australis]OSM02479.1 putative MotA/TolQ/ExbB proton channel [Magnetofaba australis IT-1]